MKAVYFWIVLVVASGASSPALSSIDFESVIASDVSISAIEDLPFDAAGDCRLQLSKLSRSRPEIEREMPRCLLFANEQVAELKETPDARYQRLQAEYPAKLKLFVDRAVARGEMNVSCLEYAHYPAMFAACRSDARRDYLARVSAPGFVPASCSQLAAHRKLAMESMSSMDYMPSRHAHEALFVGEVVHMRGGELTVNFGGRDAMVEIQRATRSYRHAALAVGAEVDGFGLARKDGVAMRSANGAPHRLAIIDAACIQ